MPESLYLTLRQAFERLRPDLAERISRERASGAWGQPPAPGGSVFRPEVAALLPGTAGVPAEARYEAATALLEALRAGGCRLVAFVEGDVQAAYVPFSDAALDRLDPGCFIPERGVVLLDGREVAARVEWENTRAPATRSMRRPGRPAEVRDRVVAEMRAEIATGKLTLDELRALKQESLAPRYDASRGAAVDARKIVLRSAPEMSLIVEN